MWETETLDGTPSAYAIARAGEPVRTNRPGWQPLLLQQFTHLIGAYFFRRLRFTTGHAILAL